VSHTVSLRVGPSIPTVKLLALAGLLASAMVPAAAIQSARPPALLTFAVSASAQSGGGGICVSRASGMHRVRVTHRDEYREPDWSPRGKFLIFRWGYELRVADARGRTAYALPHYFDEAEVLQSDPAWSPDGKLIAFAGEFRTFAAIVVTTRRGAGWRFLDRQFENFASSPTWSPSSRKLAYAKTVGTEPPSVYTIRLDGSSRRLVATSASDPDWSPDGLRLAYAQGGDIVVSRTDGSDPRPLTRTPEEESNPAWSPDGRRLAFERRNGTKSWIVVANADGTNEHIAIRSRHYDALEPSWRPPVTLPRVRRSRCR
jgi:Tol biopolymer transport system component